MGPIFTLIQSTSTSEEEQMERLYTLLLDTEYLADEPEFEDYYLSPAQSLELINQSEETFGIDILDLPELPEDEREVTQLRLLSQIVEQLLTPVTRNLTILFNGASQRSHLAGNRAEPGSLSARGGPGA
jgi:hypothetical protein